MVQTCNFVIDEQFSTSAALFLPRQILLHDECSQKWKKYPALVGTLCRDTHEYASGNSDRTSRRPATMWNLYFGKYVWCVFDVCGVRARVDRAAVEGAVLRQYRTKDPEAHLCYHTVFRK